MKAETVFLAVLLVCIALTLSACTPQELMEVDAQTKDMLITFTVPQQEPEMINTFSRAEIVEIINPYFSLQNTTDELFRVDHLGNIYLYNLTGCDTLDTNAEGVLSCGTDDGVTYTNASFDLSQLANTGNVNIGDYNFSVNDRVGIGTSSPSVELDMIGEFDLAHTAISNTERAFDIFVNTSSFADIKAFEIDYYMGSLAAEQFDAVIDIIVEDRLSTGGTVEIIRIDKIGEGVAREIGIAVGGDIQLIMQDSGSFGNMAVALVNTSGVLTNATGNFTTVDEDLDFFVNDDDYVYIGHTEEFDVIEFLLNVTSSQNANTIFQHSTAAGWDTFVPIDGTTGFTQDGTIGWEKEDLTNWAALSVNGSNLFWIRLQRTRNNIVTNPIEDLIQIIVATEYTWGEEGDLVIKNATLSGDLVISSLLNCDTINTTSEGKLVCGADSGTIYTNSSFDLSELVNTGNINVSVQNISDIANLLLGNTDEDHFIYFYEDSNATMEYLKWDNGNDRFEFSDYLRVEDGIYATQTIASEGNLYSDGDIYTTGAGDNLWLGDATQSSALFQANTTGDVLVASVYASAFYDDGVLLTANTDTTYANSSFDLSQLANTGNIVVGDYNFSVNGTTFYVDATNERVGIGADPIHQVAKLEVFGPSCIHSPIDDLRKHLWSYASNDAFYNIYDDTENISIQLYADNPSYFLDSVGIGTTAPTQKLDVNGSVNVSGSSGKLYSPEICIAGDCKTVWPSDTNASTACSGTTTYLDGEGNCDDISSIYAPIGYGDGWNKTYADTLYTNETDTDTNLTEDNVEAYIFDDDNTANLNITGYNATVENLLLAGNTTFKMYANETCVVINVATTYFEVCV